MSLTEALYASLPIFVSMQMCEYFSTRPANGAARGHFDQERESWSAVRDMIVNRIGQRKWSYISNVVLNNLWISTFVITLISPLLTISQGNIVLNYLFIKVLCVTFTPQVWRIRKAIAENLPIIAQSIATHLPRMADSVAQFMQPRLLQMAN